MSIFKPLSMPSIRALVGKSEEVLIYGTSDCGWEWLPKQLDQAKSPIKKAYDYSIATPDEPTKTLKHEVITQIAPWAKGNDGSTAKQIAKRICKTALVDWAIEVWKRKGSDKQIPLIFAIDRTGNPYPPSAENFLSKTKAVHGLSVNTLITHAEIRRLYKLCTDETIDKEVREAVRENIRFVRLKIGKKKTFLKSIPTPWEDPQWKDELAKRKDHKRTEEDGQGKKEYDWRKELNDAVKAERALRVAKKDPVDFKSPR